MMTLITGLHSKKSILRYEEWLDSTIKKVKYTRVQEGEKYRLEIHHRSIGKLNYVIDFENAEKWMRETLYPKIKNQSQTRDSDH